MIEVLKQALEALETSQTYVQASSLEGYGDQLDKADEAIAAIKAAQPEQEPSGHFLDFAYSDSIAYVHVYDQFRKGQQFYKAPPQRTWVWLKDEEIWSLITRIGSGNSDVNPLTILADVRAVEFRIHMKNSDVKQEPQRTEQEPVADDFFKMIADRNPKAFPPPQRTWVGLTDEEVQTLRYKIDSTANWTYDEFAKVIQAELKKKNT